MCIANVVLLSTALLIDCPVGSTTVATVPTIKPLSFTRRITSVSVKVSVDELFAPEMLTISVSPFKSIIPMICEPESRLRVSAPLPPLIASSVESKAWIRPLLLTITSASLFNRIPLEVVPFVIMLPVLVIVRLS